MILYRGKIYQNSRQNEMIESLKNDVYSPLTHGEALSHETVINACDKLAKKVLNGDFDNIVKPFLSLFNISDSQFRDMLNLFSKQSLEYKCSIELCDNEKIIDGKIFRKRGSVAETRIFHQRMRRACRRAVRAHGAYIVYSG